MRASRLVLLAAVVFAGAPVAVVLAAAVFEPAFLGLSSESWVGGGGLLGARWFAHVLELYGDHLQRSLAIAAAVALASAALALPAAWALLRFDSRPVRFVRGLALAPLAVPGVAVAMGWALAYPALRRHPAALVLAHLIYALPFALNPVAAALCGQPLAELEAAAASLGAGPRARLWRVVLPLARPGLVRGALAAFAISLGEFNVTFLLAPPQYATYPCALYATYTTNSLPVAAAATALFLALALPALAAITALDRSATARFGSA